jgi:tRNA A-37 threonylcarbamoyl transferase component Bud32
MTLAGTIADARLEEAFQAIVRQKKSGALVAQLGGDVVRVFLRDGLIVGADSSIRPLPMRLGSLLLEARIIDQSQLAEALKAQEGSLRLGEILVAKGWLRREDLVRVSRLQLTDTIHQLLRWIGASFRFEEKGEPADRTISALPFEDLTREGGWSRLNERFPSNREYFVRDRIISEGTQLSSSARRLHALLHPERPLLELIQLGRMSQLASLTALAELIEGGFAKKIDPPARPEPGPIAAPSGQEVADPLVGTRLDRYMILARIGEGRTSRVYRARHVLAERELALKLYHPNARPRQEPEATKKVRHRNVVAMEGLGSSGGYVFWVMELVQGTTLDQLLRREPLSERRAARIARQVALGLEAIHSAGLTHGDLRAENVLVSSVDLAVKLFDFSDQPPVARERDLAALLTILRQLNGNDEKSRLAPVAKRMPESASSAAREIDRAFLPIDLSASETDEFLAIRTTDLEKPEPMVEEPPARVVPPPVAPRETPKEPPPRARPPEQAPPPRPQRLPEPEPELEPEPRRSTWLPIALAAAVLGVGLWVLAQALLPGEDHPDHPSRKLMSSAEPRPVKAAAEPRPVKSAAEPRPVKAAAEARAVVSASTVATSSASEEELSGSDERPGARTQR